DRQARHRFHGEPRGEIDVELVDQDDVADRKSGEHGGQVRPDSSCPALCRASTSSNRAQPKDADGRDKRAFTPVFDGLCPAMTLWVERRQTAGHSPSKKGVN